MRTTDSFLHQQRYAAVKFILSSINNHHKAAWAPFRPEICGLWPRIPGKCPEQLISWTNFCLWSDIRFAILPCMNESHPIYQTSVDWNREGMIIGLLINLRLGSFWRLSLVNKVFRHKKNERWKKRMACGGWNRETFPPNCLLSTQAHVAKSGIYLTGSQMENHGGIGHLQLLSPFMSFTLEETLRIT